MPVATICETTTLSRFEASRVLIEGYPAALGVDLRFLNFAEERCQRDN
jgi:hypothetical protein